MFPIENMVKTKWKSTRDYYKKLNIIKRSIIKRKVEMELKILLNIQHGNITMIRQINKIFVYKQVYFMYAL